MTDRDYNDYDTYYGSTFSGPPTKIYKQLAEDEAAKRYDYIKRSSCTKCNRVGPTYYKGSCTRWCSNCIEEDFMNKFKALHKEILKYKSKKI